VRLFFCAYLAIFKIEYISKVCKHMKIHNSN